MHPNSSSIPPILTVRAMDHPAYPRSVARVHDAHLRRSRGRRVQGLYIILRGATSRRLVPQRTTPRDGNGRDNYLDSGEYMLPSAAWDLPAVVSMVFHGVAGVPVVAPTRCRWSRSIEKIFLENFFSTLFLDHCHQFRIPLPPSEFSGERIISQR